MWVRKVRSLMRERSPSKNERLSRYEGRYAPGLKGRDRPNPQERATVMPEAVCSKKYKNVCDGNVIVSIRNPDHPHLRIKLCGPCFMVYAQKKPGAVE